ncbi:Hypothetical protein AKI40_1497 [Enterobacter sp. FY-07]|nr:Hypothetical protein AKI40_1497 [Enterobacter sp. FY-07]
MNNKADADFLAIAAYEQGKQRHNSKRQDKVQNAGHICSKYETGRNFLHILCNKLKENEIKHTLY